MLDAIIAVPTFRRPDGLKQLLASLEPSLAAHNAAVVVGDNACDSATQAIVENFRTRYPRTLYLEVSARGISQNRNALLNAYRAMEPAAWFGMLDDDLTAPPDWLERMIAIGQRCDADAVGGPYSIAGASQITSRTVRNSILVRRPDFATGPVDIFHAGGNCLFARRFIIAEPLICFDPDLGRSGGEDYELLTRAKARGARFAWCSEARCVEDFPIERATKSYVYHRYYSTGNSMGRIEARRRGKLTILCETTSVLAKSVIRGLCRAACADADGAIRMSMNAFWAVGGIVGALGVSKSERY